MARSYSSLVSGTVLAFAVGVFACWISAVAAEPQLLPPSNREYQIKAAFLYNFVKFVEWEDPAPNDSIRICVLGQDLFGAALDSLAGKTLKGKSVAIQRFAGPDVGLRGCHVLFVSRSETERLSEILTPLANSPVLTVGETEEFTRAGGIITFTSEENKIRFAIDVNAAERARLKISSKLLNLAKVVR